MWQLSFTLIENGWFKVPIFKSVESVNQWISYGWTMPITCHMTSLNVRISMHINYICHFVQEYEQVIINLNVQYLSHLVEHILH